MNPPPELLPALTVPSPPPKPHPIDVALAALGEVAAELLAGNRPSRFAEIQNVMHVAQAVQRIRPAESASVADMGLLADGEFDEGVAIGPMIRPPIRVAHGGGARWNDAADLNTQVLMMAQNFLKEYTAIEKAKASKPDPDVRLNVVGELAELFMLRLKLAGADEDVPVEINVRIDHLLKRIGEPPHEPSKPAPESGPNTLVSADSLRGHQADGERQPDRGRVGEPLAE